jgi:pilus assembly protein CpaB
VETGRLEQWRTRITQLPLRMVVPLVIAVLSGAAAYWFGVAYLEQAERRVSQRYAAQHAVRAVLVAARPLAAGTRLEPTVLARRQVPARYVPRSAYPPDAAADLYGRALSHPLDAGETVTPAVIASADAPSLSAQFLPGKRALTIAVDDTNSHAGLVRPGDLVDLLWVTDAGVTAPDALTAQPLLQAVRVLATGKTLRPAPSGSVAGADSSVLREFTTLTLLVTPTDAARTALAERTGEVLITLRASDDRLPTTADRMTLASLLGTAGRVAVRTAPHGYQIAGWIGGRGGASPSHRWTVGVTGAGRAP